MKNKLLLLAPIPGILLGMFAAYSAGISYSVFYPNLVGVILGILLMFAMGKKLDFPKVPLLVGLFLLLSVLGVCFLHTDVEGVYRWVRLGPVNINVSELCLPLIIFAIFQLLKFGNPAVAEALVAIALVSVIHFFQPDAAQATAFAAAISFILVVSKELKKSVRAFGILISVVAAIFTWFQTDTLPAVEHVERILHLIADFGVLGYLAIVVAIGLLFLPFIGNFKNKLSQVFLSYLVATYLATEVGNFPVPVIGAGISTVISWYWMVILMNQPKS